MGHDLVLPVSLTLFFDSKIIHFLVMIKRHKVGFCLFVAEVVGREI